MWELFVTFFTIGIVSFGGGYAMIPLIQEEIVVQHQWMSIQEFTDVIAVAGMSPGPIATNSAIFIGYNQMGVWGAVVSAVGMILPSLIIILMVGAIFYKVQKNIMVKSALYGLRAIITGLIVYAAILFAVNNGLVTSFSFYTMSLLVIYGASLVALIYFKIHPVYVILISGLIGIAVYG
ncbi:chromate transporter [Chengkuizengella axinellae]|uniref:Chromate transporter n=1 Tax=Chengkuizengella axinellae TaxID=3064388 RepID=A0ABT9IZK5_9BACL|nr:chromate transporter [Chengkuizengella sp. 2205SS18-9]MDP5274819.1 chromate transporter [Chengkuizengella sp. 2205SS18-9]